MMDKEIMILVTHTYNTDCEDDLAYPIQVEKTVTGSKAFLFAQTIISYSSLVADIDSEFVPLLHFQREATAAIKPRRVVAASQNKFRDFTSSM